MVASVSAPMMTLKCRAISGSNMAAGADCSMWWPSDSSSDAAPATAARHCGSSR